MATMTIEDQELLVTLTGAEKFSALRGNLRVPLSSIDSVEVLADGLHLVKGLKAPGIGLPGARVGTWRSPGARRFCVVRRDQAVVRVQLKAGEFTELVIGSDNPNAIADQLR